MNVNLEHARDSLLNLKKVMTESLNTPGISEEQKQKTVQTINELSESIRKLPEASAGLLETKLKATWANKTEVEQDLTQDRQFNLRANYIPDPKTPTSATGRNAGGIIQAFANGGQALLRAAVGSFVPGVGNQDTVPAILTPGEYVVKKSSVAKYGLAFMNALNSGMMNLSSASGMLSGGYNVAAFAGGGSVGGSSGSRDVVNVNLNLGSKSFPLSGDRSIVNTLVSELQKAKGGLSR